MMVSKKPTTPGPLQQPFKGPQPQVGINPQMAINQAQLQKIGPGGHIAPINTIPQIPHMNPQMAQINRMPPQMAHKIMDPQLNRMGQIPPMNLPPTQINHPLEQIDGNIEPQLNINLENKIINQSPNNHSQQISPPPINIHNNAGNLHPSQMNNSQQNQNFKYNNNRPEQMMRNFKPSPNEEINEGRDNDNIDLNTEMNRNFEVKKMMGNELQTQKMTYNKITPQSFQQHHQPNEMMKDHVKYIFFIYCLTIF